MLPDMAHDPDEIKTLPQLFQEAFKVHLHIENGSLSPGDESYQNAIKQALKLLSILSARIEELTLFSLNEEASEISSANLKYLLPPALSGILTSLLQTPREERKDLLESSEKFLIQYLERCKNYGIGPVKDIERALKKENDSATSSGSDLASLNAKREAKIAKFKRGRDLEARLEHFRSLVGENDENIENVDDEVVRKYWISVTEKLVETAMENLDSIAQEKEILKFWEKMPDKANPPRPEPPKQTSNGIPKNFILTRDKVQGAVFGAGYPSLPTMTVEEFYESHAAAGTLPDQGPGTSQKMEEEEQGSSDDDNDEKLQRQRAFDDWKDTHRRGDGNRKNKG